MPANRKAIDPLADERAQRKVLSSKIMDEGWRNLLESVIPPETHPDQVKTYKRFYYAGAKRCMDALVFDAALDEGEQPTADDLAKVDALLHEVNAFFSEVAAGRQ